MVLRAESGDGAVTVFGGHLVRVRSLLRFSSGGGGIDAIFGEGRVFSGEQDVRVFLGVVGEAKAAAALGNKRSRPLPRPGASCSGVGGGVGELRTGARGR